MKDSPINTVVDLMLDAGATYQESEETLRVTMLRRALQRTRGNIFRAAALIRMHRNHFQRELKMRDLAGLPKQLRESSRRAGEQLPLWHKKSLQRSNQRSHRAA